MTTGLTAKEQTLVGIGAAIASGCQPCTAQYVQAARAAGACERSIRLAIETALAERQKATDAMAEWARAVQGTFPTVDESFRAEKRKNTAIVASVAAYAVHSTATLESNQLQALELGWSQAQLEQALNIARGVADVATQKVDAVALSTQATAERNHGSCCAESAEPCAATPAGPSSCGCTSGCSGA